MIKLEAKATKKKEVVIELDTTTIKELKTYLAISKKLNYVSKSTKIEDIIEALVKRELESKEYENAKEEVEKKKKEKVTTKANIEGKANIEIKEVTKENKHNNNNNKSK